MSGYVHGTVSVGTTATDLFSSPTNESGGVLVKNSGPVAVFLGGSTVTAGTAATAGLLLNPGESVTVTSTGASSADLYAITATGTAYVSYLWV